MQTNVTFLFKKALPLFPTVSFFHPLDQNEHIPRMEIYFITVLNDPQTRYLPLVKQFVSKGKLKHENATRVKSMPLPNRQKQSKLKQITGKTRFSARNFVGLLIGLSMRTQD